MYILFCISTKNISIKTILDKYTKNNNSAPSEISRTVFEGSLWFFVALHICN